MDSYYIYINVQKDSKISMNIIKQKRNEKNDEGDEGYSLGRPELDFRAFQKERAQIIINESKNSRNFMRVLFVRHLSMAYCYRAH